uniref:Uncharacterized protein n=1 Tax=Plectus sambesii TaxID=2011161 RepID=A0A914VEH6_9BILA
MLDLVHRQGILPQHRRRRLKKARGLFPFAARLSITTTVDHHHRPAAAPPPQQPSARPRITDPVSVDDRQRYLLNYKSSNGDCLSGEPTARYGSRRAICLQLDGGTDRAQRGGERRALTTFADCEATRRPLIRRDRLAVGSACPIGATRRDAISPAAIDCRHRSTPLSIAQHRFAAVQLAVGSNWRAAERPDRCWSTAPIKCAPIASSMRWIGPGHCAPSTRKQIIGRGSPAENDSDQSAIARRSNLIGLIAGVWLLRARR